MLTKAVGVRLREIMRQGWDLYDIQLIKGRVSHDHLHLSLSYPPQRSVSAMVRMLKGRSSRKIQDEFPHLGKQYWGKHFWGIGYAAFSAGHVTEEMIQEDLAQPENHPHHNADDFIVE